MALVPAYATVLQPGAKRAPAHIGTMNKSVVKLLGSAALALSLVACANRPGERSAGQVFDDTAILAKTKAALVKDPDIHGASIDVDVNRGQVTLTGVVRSEAERKKVLETVWGVKGVQGVQTDLKVEPVNP
jgi:osmotically-inducible protein OsmY